MAGLVGNCSVLGDTMDADGSVFKKFHVAIVLAVSVADPAVVGSHFPSDLLFDIGMIVGDGVPVVSYAKLGEGTFKHVEFAVLAVFHVPFAIEFCLVKRNVAGS